MENKQHYAAVLTALAGDPVNIEQLRGALAAGDFAAEQLSSLLPQLFRYYGEAEKDEITAAALKELLKYGADPKAEIEKKSCAFDLLEKALDHVHSYEEAEFLRHLWQIMQSDGPMPVFLGVLAWTTPDFHEAYERERAALKKAGSKPLFGRKKPTAPIDRYFTAENFYYRYDAECRCYLLYERGSDKLVGGRGDIPKKYHDIAIAEGWRG